MTIDYIEAWQRWFSGQQLADFHLWGHPLLWWARLGKLMQFAAGLAILLDLFGPKRLRTGAARLLSYGRGALGRMSPAGRRYLEDTRASGLLAECRRPPRVWRALAARERRPGRYSRLVELRESRAAEAKVLVGELPDEVVARARLANRATVVIAVVSVVLTGYLRELGTTAGAVAATIAFFFAMTSLLGLVHSPLRMLGPPFYRVVAVMSWWAAVVIAAGFVVALLGEGRDGHPLRWLAFGLFVVGFHFDLLGS